MYLILKRHHIFFSDNPSLVPEKLQLVLLEVQTIPVYREKSSFSTASTNQKIKNAFGQKKRSSKNVFLTRNFFLPEKKTLLDKKNVSGQKTFLDKNKKVSGLKKNF